MAKFYTTIGYADPSENAPGVWQDNIIEKHYYAELVSNRRRLENSGSLNDNISVSAEISIVADAYANNHFHEMRYVEFMGAKWKVVSAEVKPPRLVLTLGGVYNA